MAVRCLAGVVAEGWPDASLINRHLGPCGAQNSIRTKMSGLTLRQFGGDTLPLTGNGEHGCRLVDAGTGTCSTSAATPITSTGST